MVYWTMQTNSMIQRNKLAQSLQEVLQELAEYFAQQEQLVED